MQLLIDFREKWAVKKVTSSDVNPPLTEGTTIVNGVSVNYCIANLEVGDFIIKDSEGNILIIVERKTIRDLSASITDGRFRQQKERLFESTNDPCKILYILEGDKGSTLVPRSESQKGLLPQTIIDGSIHNLIFRHKFKVVWTDGQSDTLNNIALLYKKFENREFDTVTQPVPPTKLVQKGSKISNNVFALQLSAIPGVSYATALVLSKSYKSMKNLVDAYNTTESEKDKESMLSNVQLTEKRKLGNALSRKIYVCTCDQVNTDL